MENRKMTGLKEDDSKIEIEFGLGSFNRGEETLEENLSLSDPESKRIQDAKKKLEEMKLWIARNGNKKKIMEDFGSGNHEEMMKANLNHSFRFYQLRIPRQYLMTPFRPFPNSFPTKRASAKGFWSYLHGRSFLNALPLVNTSFSQFRRDSEPVSVDSEAPLLSNGSPARSSSIVSDLQNSSVEGGSSSIDSVISEQMESASKIKRCALKEEFNLGNQSTETKNEMDKLLELFFEPRTQNENIPSILPHMPRVTTTGSGPKGKKIKGFLYKYSNSEVDILCVCHGSSFSPEVCILCVSLGRLLSHEVGILCVCHGSSFSPAEFVHHAEE